MTYYVNEDDDLILIDEEELSLESGNAWLIQWELDQQEDD